MEDGIKLSPTVKTTKADLEVHKSTLEHERKLREQGLLGRLFGTAQTSAHNVAGFTVLSLVIIGALYTFFVVMWYGNEIEKIKDFWGVLMPIITLVMGYLFGKGSTPESSE
jgi:hypothetical protein